MYRIKNWQEFQHYGDKRTPPWIKLHYEILTSETWIMIDDASKLLAIVCMLLASRNRGEVKGSAAYIQKVGNLNRLPNFKPLIDIGFLIPLDDASNMQALAPESSSLSSSLSLSKGGVGESENGSHDDFTEFWQQFPRQRIGSRPAAHKSWQKTIQGGEITPATLLSVVLAYGSSDEVRRGYAKGCAAWLNAECWRNDYSIKTKDRNHDNIHRPNADTAARRRSALADAVAARAAARAENTGQAV